MMPLQNTATKVMVAPQTLTSAGTAAGWVDTLGYEEAAIDFIVAAVTATGANPSVCALAECEATSAVSNAVAITGLTGDATDGFTIPAVDTSNPTIIRMNVDLRARKRYLYATFACGTGTPSTGVAVVATLGKAKDTTIARAQMSGIAEV
jgi:hypothetical protein